MTQIERGFVSIREGQVHYRRSGAAAGGGGGFAGVAKADSAATRLPLWMLHASPASSVTLIPLVRELGRSRAVWAPDTLGNGDSAPASPAVPDAAYYADSSLRVMDALGVERADLYGSHTGAHIAVEMVIQQPQRFGRLILDGIGMFDEASKREYLARYAPAVEPDFFGTQFHWAWHFVRDQGWFFPYFKRDVAHLRGTDAPSVDALHDITLEVLKSIRTYHHAYRAAFAHPDHERLPLVGLPTLVMADESDPLKGGVPLAAERLPRALQTIFSPKKGEDYAAAKCAMLARFLDTGSVV